MATRTALVVGLGFLCLEATALHTMTEQRRGFLGRAAPAAVAVHAAFFAAVPPSPMNPTPDSNNVANAAELVFFNGLSGKQYQYADAKIGTGEPPDVGTPVLIDYVMSTNGAARGSKIYSTADAGLPYQWVIGDRSTVPGLERAVAGGDGVPPMLPGGIRRVIIAGDGTTTTDNGSTRMLGYDVRECAEGVGPGPTPRGETYQRFRNAFCNPQRPEVPELVFDVKLLLRSQISTYVIDDEE